jgi:aspartate dehydrogenase
MTRVAIAGLGAIGRVLARKLADGMPGLTLACAAVRDRKKAQTWLDTQQISCPLVEPEEFPARADLAIECAPAAVLERICRPMLEAGKRVMVLSAGALLQRPELMALATARSSCRRGRCSASMPSRPPPKGTFIRYA